MGEWKLEDNWQFAPVALYFFPQLLEEKLQNAIMFNSVINFIGRFSGTPITCVLKILWMWGTLPVF